ALRCLQAGEAVRAVALLPEPARAGSVPDWVAMVHGVRARVLWQAGEIDAARQEWTALLAVLSAAPDAWLIDDVVVSPWAIYYTGDALPHLADAAFLTAAERWLQSREALARGRVFVPEVATCGLRQAALVPLALGRLDQAEARLQRALAWCEQSHCP